MGDRIRRLRTRLQALTRGKAPTGIRYPAMIRAEIVGLMGEARTHGIGMARVAARLGVPVGTIAQWQQAAPRRTLRRVTLAADAATPLRAPSPSLVLVTPQGRRIEGLDVATLLQLLPPRG
jgi:hypothetical protein